MDSQKTNEVSEPESDYQTEAQVTPSEPEVSEEVIEDPEEFEQDGDDEDPEEAERPEAEQPEAEEPEAEQLEVEQLEVEQPDGEQPDGEQLEAEQPEREQLEAEDEQQEFEPEDDDEEPEEPNSQVVRYQLRPRPVKTPSLFQSFLVWANIKEEDDYVPSGSNSDSDESFFDAKSMIDSDDDIEDPAGVSMKDKDDIMQDSDDEIEVADEEDEDVEMVAVQVASSKIGIKRPCDEEPNKPTKRGKKDA